MNEETMLDEFSLVDSQTVGTGYVISNLQDGSVSMITDDQVAFGDGLESRTTITDNADVELSGWNVINKLLFSKVSTSMLP